MVSLPRQIRFFSRTKVILPFVIVTMCGGFYAFGYRPHDRQLDQLNSQIISQRGELLSSQTQTSILPTVIADVERLRTRLAKQKTLTDKKELSQFIKDISQLGQQASLKKFDMKPGVPSRSEGFNELPIQLTFEGDFANVFSFLRHTEELTRLTRVRSMSVSGKDKSGAVKAQLTLSLYFAAGTE